MDLARVRREVDEAQRTFALVECYPTNDGSLYVRAALQTSERPYIVSVFFPDTYPYSMPNVFVRQPDLRSDAPHRYQDGNICYLYHKMWNPGSHNLTFVIMRTAKWLNKYEVWLATRKWPGKSMAH
jgi:ubiquitin-protein ligase